MGSGGDVAVQPSYPNPPSGSRAWRVIQFPLVALFIGLIAVILPSTLFQLGAAKLLGVTPRTASPATSLLTTLGGVLAAVAGYCAFNRWVERRGNVEFALPDAARELGAGLLAGTLLFSVVVGVIALFGGYHVIGHNGPAVLVHVLALSIGSGVVEELIARGLIFRLIEQWSAAGSRWRCRRRCSARRTSPIPIPASSPPPASRSRRA